MAQDLPVGLSLRRVAHGQEMFRWWSMSCACVDADDKDLLCTPNIHGTRGVKPVSCLDFPVRSPESLELITLFVLSDDVHIRSESDCFVLWMWIIGLRLPTHGWYALRNRPPATSLISPLPHTQLSIHRSAWSHSLFCSSATIFAHSINLPLFFLLLCSALLFGLLSHRLCNYHNYIMFFTTYIGLCFTALLYVADAIDYNPIKPPSYPL